MRKSTKTRMHLTRRAFLALTTTMVSEATLGSLALCRHRAEKIPITGVAIAGLEPFDRMMTSFVINNNVPGASLAVTRNGRLVYARGFGFSDVEQQEPVQPAALFRIASVSKPITAVAIMQLAERRRLRLDAKVVDLMNLNPFVQEGKNPDPRWKEITIRHCLQHTGGWDRDQSYDPIDKPWDIANALGKQPPVTPADIVQYMMGQPLDFDPGARYAYSNLGYLVLGRVLEAVSQRSYEDYVKDKVLSPLGIDSMKLGRALFEHRQKGEVKYYDSKNRTGQALYPPRRGKQVPIQYGAFNFESFEAHGGWIASAVDLVKLTSALCNPLMCPILGAKAISEMWARPNGPGGLDENGKPKAAYYGCGWWVRRDDNSGRFNAWHTGLIPGSEALLVRRWDGLNWAVLFNTAYNPDGKSLAELIDGLVHQAADQVRFWPDLDQFDDF